MAVQPFGQIDFPVDLSFRRFGPFLSLIGPFLNLDCLLCFIYKFMLHPCRRCFRAVPSDAATVYMIIYIRTHAINWRYTIRCFALFFSRPRSEGWSHHRRTFSVYVCPLSFWLSLSRVVLSTCWCCPSRPCVVFLACVHLTLFLALSLFSSSLFTPALLRTHSFVFCPVHETRRIFLSPFISKASKRVYSFFLIS